ncbi:glycoside hydrolase family 44 protein [Archangium primigenium]|uniref:glycoside hydrolase family 44 protein n=1 Tax=[Archangium] primigenium TaxID=2792470 RepID=UPI00195EC707|nr:glycoside hydrolase family 44 protein [Archangium primigenium]MBM7112367.1 glycosyl hydrolase [Archangium primigenium]
MGRTGRGRRALVALSASVCLGGLSGCKGCNRGESQAATASTPIPGGVYDIPALTETAFATTLQAGWTDEGWSPRETKEPGPAKLRLSNMGGWMLSKPDLSGDYGGLALRYRAPEGYGDFLEVRLDSEGEVLFPRVRVDARHVARREQGWTQLFIPFEQLNPQKKPFTKLVLRAYKPVGADWVEVDQLGLTGPGGMTLVEGIGAAEPATAQAAGAPEAPKPTVAPQELAYDNGLGEGWVDGGWAPHELQAQGPAKFKLARMGGWSLSKKDLPAAELGGLTLRYRAPAGFGDFLEVRLDSDMEALFPRVKLSDTYVTLREDGWTQVFVPMDELNPKKLPFTKLVLRAHKDVGPDEVALNQVGFGRLVTPDAAPVAAAPIASAPLPASPSPASLPSAASVGGGRLPVGNARPSRVVVDCTAPGHAISPLIYGIAFNNLRELKDKHQWELGATARRWGGNPTSRYNWKLGNVWNTANDYFFRNIVLGTSPQYTADTFLETNLKNGVQSALTVPMLGWVAKDATSTSFPRSLFGPQQKMDPDVPEAGNGLASGGDALVPPVPTLTSVEAPPAFIHEWVRTLREKDKKRGRSVQMYILDNEPMLWNTTHRDVHPEPVTYDELLERTIAYGTAVRQADPDAIIAGPAEWGWTNYFSSAADVVPGGNKKDRKAHGNVPLVAWYLKKLREHEKQTGTRILDVFDLHFYPQGEGIGFEERGETDAATSARRIRSVRALWDPKFRDESWIDDTVELIPRMRRWVSENAPGLGLSLGEYNFGATQHMSGGLAQAEALGRFAEQGLTSAFLFTYPPAYSPTFWAFRAYRNFDGKGGRFLDTYVPSRFDSDVNEQSLFASRSDDGRHMVAVALNLSPNTARNTQVELKGCGNVTGARLYTYRGDATGFAPNPSLLQSGSTVQTVLSPWSMAVLDLTLAQP